MAIWMRGLGAIVLLLGAVCPASADLMIKTKVTNGGYTMEYTYYYKNGRWRYVIMSDTGDARITSTVTIFQCDLKRSLMIIERNKRYLVTSLGEAAPSNPNVRKAGEGDGLINHITTVTALGEERQILGFKAHHLKVSVRVELPEGCSALRQWADMTNSDSDGWYADLGVEGNDACFFDGPLMQSAAGCARGISRKYVGADRLGYPLLATGTIRVAGAELTTTSEVIEISRADLDASLFNPPEGYVEAKDALELYALPKERPEAGPPSGLVEPRKESVKRVGVVMIDNTTNVAAISPEQLQGALVVHLAKQNIDAVPLLAHDDAEVRSEAEAKKCDYVLHATLTDARRLGEGRAGAVRSGARHNAEAFEVHVDFRLSDGRGMAPDLTSKVVLQQTNAADIVVSLALEKVAEIVALTVRKRK